MTFCFLVITLSYMVMIYSMSSYTATNCLLSHLTKFGPIYASVQQKCLENIFFVTLRGGCTCTPAPTLATSVRLVPKVMTLNDLEPRNGRYFALVVEYTVCDRNVWSRESSF